MKNNPTITIPHNRMQGVLLPLLLCCLILSTTVYPQYNVKFEHITTEDGLSHNVVYHILQDRQGFLWFATEAGLNKYDGYRFTVFKESTLAPGSTRPLASIAGVNVSRLLEDKNGKILLATWGYGLWRLDPATGGFENFRYTPGNPGGISDNFVRTIYQDREGTLWVGTNKGGLNRFKPKTGSFKHYLHNPENSNSICDNRIWDICEDRKGNLLIGTENGLSLFNPREEHFVLFKNRPCNPTSLDNNKVRVLHVTPGGMIWVGTQTGVNRYNDREKHFTRYPLSNEKNGPAVIISALFSDRPGKLW
ncbi:MAG: hypothetical protein GY757_07490, partial [bacterium]|nr:hypothetical protein [bacterium]